MKWALIGSAATILVVGILWQRRQNQFLLDNLETLMRDNGWELEDLQRYLEEQKVAAWMAKRVAKLVDARVNPKPTLLQVLKGGKA